MPLIMSFLVQLQAWWFTVLLKNNSILDAFCEICEILQNLIFTEDSWASALISSNIFTYHLLY